MKIGIYGYGNLGKGVESAIKHNADTELYGIFTRRDPASLSPLTEGASVFSVNSILEHKDDMQIYYRLADLYTSQGDRYSAINILQRGVKAFPDVNELSEYLSGLYIKDGQYEKALEFARNDYSMFHTQ